jgi:hypothetical protein
MLAFCNVRFGSVADITDALAKSPLCASSGHARTKHQSGAEPMAMSRSECIVACLAGGEYRRQGEQFETRALTLFTDI